MAWKLALEALALVCVTPKSTPFERSPRLVSAFQKLGQRGIQNGILAGLGLEIGNRILGHTDWSAPSKSLVNAAFKMASCGLGLGYRESRDKGEVTPYTMCVKR